MARKKKTAPSEPAHAAPAPPVATPPSPRTRGPLEERPSADRFGSSPRTRGPLEERPSADRFGSSGAEPPAPPLDPAPRTRREFLTRLGAAALLASGAGAAAAAVRFAVPETVAGAPERFPLGTPADFKVRTVTWLRDRELFVVRDEQGFGAFSSRCTHLGCTVRRTAQGYACPCHGARFDEAGRVAAGPARRGLPWFALALEGDGRIWIDRSRERPPGTAPLLSTEA